MEAEQTNDEESDLTDPEITLDAVYQTLSTVLNSLATENALLNKRHAALQEQFNVVLKRAEEYEELIKKLHSDIEELRNTMTILNARMVSITKQFTAALRVKRSAD
jgi:cell division protein FtsB